MPRLISSREGRRYRRSASVVAALAALLVVGAASAVTAATEARSIFGHLNQLEADARAHGDFAQDAHARLEATDAELTRRHQRAEVADRASRPIRQAVEKGLARWMTVFRVLDRGGVQGTTVSPSSASDTRHLLAAAADRAVAGHLDDAGVLRQAVRDQRLHDELMVRRGRVSVDFARSRATADARSAERTHLIDEVRGDAERIEAELRTSGEALHKGLSRLLTNDTTEDFHRQKGTLRPPVSTDPEARFGRRKQRGSASFVRHTGYTYRVEEGTEVRSAAGGLVVYAERFEGYGNLVIIDHGSGYHTLYAHLGEIDVAMGTRIGRSGVVGRSGATGSLEGPKFYFELRHDGLPIDPSSWFLQKS